MRTRSSFALLVTLAVFAIFASFLVWPLVESLRGAFVAPSGQWTLAYFGVVLRTPMYVEGFLNSLAVATGATIVATTIGAAMAVTLDRFDFPGKGALSALVPLPLVVPPFVGALGVKQLLGQNGALNAFLVAVGVERAGHPVDWLQEYRFVAVVLLTALHLYPVVFFNVSAALSRIGPEMEEAAENLGATWIGRLTKITLPLVMPSLFAAVTIVFIWGLAELGVPLVCDYTRVTSVQILSGLNDIGRSPVVYVLVVMMLVVTTSLYVAARLTFGRTVRAIATKSNALRTPTKLRPLPGWLCTGVFGGAITVAALPNLAVVLLAVAGDWYGTVFPSTLTLEHFESALGHDLVVPSIANSLRYVSFSTTIDIVLGVAIAFAVVRSRSRLGHVLDVLAMLPLAVPGIVLAFGYLAIAREGRPFAFLNPGRDPTALLVIAYAIRRLPFVVRAATAGLQQVSITLEEAAANLGASPVRTFLRVTLPLLAPHLLAGGVFAFALSLLEVSDSLILAQKQATFPITKAIFELTQMLGDGRGLAAALGVWAMAFLGSAVAFARSELGRRVGAIFRS